MRWGMESLLHDVKYGFRLLGKSPGFTAVAIIALALGIGANTLMFSVVNSVLLRPLPFSQAGELVLAQGYDRSTGHNGAASPPDFYRARRDNHSFDQLAAYYQRVTNISGDPEAERVQRLMVSPEFFDALRIAPALGRSFTPQDERWGQHRVVLLTDALWKRRYGADPAIVGKSINLNLEPYQVIGVLPPDFSSFLGLPVGMFSPMSFAPGDNLNTHNNYFLTMVGRLKRGTTVEQANSDLAAIFAAIEKEFPENKGLSARATSLQESVVQDVRPAIVVLMGAVGFVLLIACANLANLLLARAAGRSREIAVRAALGARRGRLLRQFITESVLLAVLGGALGLFAAYWGTDAIHLISRRALPRVDEIHVDVRVLWFTFAISLATGVLFGLAPALHSLRLNLNDALKEGTRTVGEGPRSLRSALVVSEVALSLILLIGAGLMFKSLQRLLQVDIGFDPQHVAATYINLPPQKYRDERLAALFRDDAAAKATQFFNDAMARIAALPGVEAVGAISNLPLTGEAWGKSLTLYDRPLPATIRDLPAMQYRVVAGDYFRALRIAILEGRAFDKNDNLASQKVVVINQTLARRFWPKESALGKQLSIDPPSALVPKGTLPPGYEGPPKYTVIGVATDVHYGAVDADPRPLVYGLHSQGSQSALGLQLVVRAKNDPMTLAPAMREQIAQIDRDVPLANLQPLESLIATQMAQPKLELWLLGSFAALALLLAAVGIYGVMAYSVTQRTREIGIRMALGAARTDVLRLLLGQGLRLVVLGLGVGLLGALALTRVMQKLLFGVSATDPIVFTVIALGLAVIAMLASYLPARRAMRVDPLVALRYE